MTTTKIYATSYDHNNDLRFHIERAQEALHGLKMLVNASEQLDAEDAATGVEVADALTTHATQILNYAVGLARFEGCTWGDVGDALEVSKQAASERFRHLAQIPRRGAELGTLTSCTNQV